MTVLFQLESGFLSLRRYCEVPFETFCAALEGLAEATGSDPATAVRRRCRLIVFVCSVPVCVGGGAG